MRYPHLYGEQEGGSKRNPYLKDYKTGVRWVRAGGGTRMVQVMSIIFMISIQLQVTHYEDIQEKQMAWMVREQG